MAILITAMLASLLALAFVVAGWRRFDRKQKLRRFEAQWQAIKEQAESPDPVVRRAAAKQAIKLIRQASNPYVRRTAIERTFKLVRRRPK